jgi:hypothetical protein
MRTTPAANRVMWYDISHVWCQNDTPRTEKAGNNELFGWSTDFVSKISCDLAFCRSWCWHLSQAVMVWHHSVTWPIWMVPFDHSAGFDRDFLATRRSSWQLSSWPATATQPQGFYGLAHIHGTLHGKLHGNLLETISSYLVNRCK